MNIDSSRCKRKQKSIYGFNMDLIITLRTQIIIRMHIQMMRALHLPLKRFQSSLTWEHPNTETLGSAQSSEETLITCQ